MKIAAPQTPASQTDAQPSKARLSRDLGRKESYAFACPKIAEVEGDGPIRFCGHCNKEVINLSSMTVDEAEDLLTKQGQAPSCVQVNVVDRKVVHQPARGGALRKMTLAIGLGLGGVALAQWALAPEPASAQAVSVGGGAAGGAFSGAVVANQTAALHRSIEAAIADARRIGQPVPEFTPPPPTTDFTPPPPGDPQAPPSADLEPAPCEPEPEILGGDIAYEPEPLGGKIAPMGGAPRPAPPPPPAE